ncbi:hypothetical protein GUJ93_ZPchr0465g6487 [Zizania palustris]|uniref:Uncharacterized protein n=1 Tax=Zizania palustris TaxID=103762 RepID=A0A8J5RBI4_ZIZPA|nr:hypothetical protein GUJ93_ZPchr0465g6487 [Zizania palustris]
MMPRSLALAIPPRRELCHKCGELASSCSSTGSAPLARLASFHGRLRLIGLTDAERAAAGRGKGSILSSSVWTTSMELMVESRAGDDDVDKRGAAPCKKRRQRLMRRWEGLAGGGDKQAAAGGAAPAPPPPPPSSLPRRCARLVKEHRARFYIVRRCVTMLACWRDYHP